MATEKPRTGDAVEARVNDGRRRVGLLTLGSAAVLTIYSAGFVRTRAAANRVADAETARHPSAEHRRAAPDSPTVPSVLGPASSARAAVDSVAVPMLRAPARASATPGGSTATAPARGNADSANIVVAQSVEATSPPPATTESAPEPVAPLAEEQPQPVPPPQPSQEQYKDGSYAGWGTSRHGDIEATVEIKAGRIVSAEITQCRTRYSCSRIASLPPQVLAKQSAEVDYVSGATQSSDAYYYAVVEALKKAQ